MRYLKLSEVKARELPTENYLSEEEYKALNLSDNDIAFRYTVENDECLSNETDMRFYTHTVYIKDNKLYGHELEKTFDDDCFEGCYIISESDNVSDIEGYLENYDVYTSQFKNDRNIHYSIDCEIVTGKLALSDVSEELIKRYPMIAKDKISM